MPPRESVSGDLLLVLALPAHLVGQHLSLVLGLRVQLRVATHQAKSRAQQLCPRCECRSRPHEKSAKSEKELDEAANVSEELHEVVCRAGYHFLILVEVQVDRSKLVPVSWLLICWELVPATRLRLLEQHRVKVSLISRTKLDYVSLVVELRALDLCADPRRTVLIHLNKSDCGCASDSVFAELLWTELLLVMVDLHLHRA